jgi:hypothetical protein
VLLTMGLILASAMGSMMLASGRGGPALANGRHASPSTAVAKPATPARLAASASRHLLNGVFCNSPADCWAVGDHAAANGGRLNQVLHWNGSKWRPVTVPSQAGTGSGDISELLAVRCTSAVDCWAVGDSQAAGSTAPELDQALHWDGKRWLLAKTPAVAQALGRFTDPGQIEDTLTDLSCPAADSCWAVGSAGGPVSGGAVLVNQVLHWDGKTWSVAPSMPDPAGHAPGDDNFLATIACTSAGNCWAAGEYGSAPGGDFSAHNEMLHWSQGKWVSVPAPNPGGAAAGDTNAIQSLSCPSASDCWAAGSYGGPGGAAWLDELLHWDGTKWSQVSVPNPAGAGHGKTNVLNGVACSSSTDCWAVGDLGDNPRRGQALHWDGSAWSRVSMPEPGGHGRADLTELDAVRCTGPANCMAVGLTRRGSVPSSDLILHWTGSKWFAS